jgi:hypothetical protein
MTCYATIIEFAGERAILNGYTMAHPMLEREAAKQVADWAARYPNAKVYIEHMTHDELRDMVAAEREAAGNGSSYSGLCHKVAARSEQA